MNKVIIIILFLAGIGIWACDTPSNITPINESFFVKLYAGLSEGDQFGNDILATSDGGLLIAGTSTSRTSQASEILLIKTDERGNEIWTSSASIAFGITANSWAKSVLELDDGYLIGGTIEEASITKSILIKTNFDGTFLQSAIISTVDEDSIDHNNNLSKITLGHRLITTGQQIIVVSGETDHPVGQDSVNQNGFIGLYLADFLTPRPVQGNLLRYFGIELDDLVTGAFEVQDTATASGIGELRFLAFGNSVDSTNFRTFYYVGLDNTYGNVQLFGATKISGGGEQISHYVTRKNDTFWMIGETNQPALQMLLVGWKYSKGVDILAETAGGNEVGNSANVVGKGVSVISENNYVVVGDISLPGESTSEIHLSKVDNFRDINDPWPKTYGTSTSTYTSSAVTTLPDGSIIVVGTADLEPIKKIIVIKTGPNGEMSF